MFRKASTSALARLIVPSQRLNVLSPRLLPPCTCPVQKAAYTNTSQRLHSFHRRTYVTRAEKNSGVRVGTLFLALSILGLGATSVGLYTYYKSLKTFPPEIRTELRSALRCKARQDYISSHKYFQKAWEKALEMQEALSILKITGIAAAWAEMLQEASSRPDEGGVRNAQGEAYTVLLDALDWTQLQLKSVPDGLVNERMRAVSIAVKLAELAEGQPELDLQTEEQLTWAVEEVLRQTGARNYQQAKALSKGVSDTESFLVAELGLPPWVSKGDIGGTLESLANLYARKGNVEYAMPLFLQCISLLIPPKNTGQADQSSVADQCHAATIMNNLSSLIASAPAAPSQDISQTAQAGAWASKAANIASSALRESQRQSTLSPDGDECKAVLVVALYNMGMLKVLEGKKEDARKLLTEAKEKSRDWKLREAELRAHESLRTI